MGCKLPRRFNFYLHICQFELNRLVVSDWSSELVTFFSVFDCFFHGPLGYPHRHGCHESPAFIEG